MNSPSLNSPTKEYPREMHTAEHILNQTMCRLFNCGRALNAHIERKKSKCDYLLPNKPKSEEIEEISRRVNEIINQKLDITEELMTREKAEQLMSLDRLPNHASELIRIIRIGDYDLCPCIGQHANNTSELGNFEIISHDYENERWRIRFRLTQSTP